MGRGNFQEFFHFPEAPGYLVLMLEQTEPASASGETPPRHKAVLFASLPSQTYLVDWVRLLPLVILFPAIELISFKWFNTFFPEIECYHFRQSLSGTKQVTCLEAFNVTVAPAVLIITLFLSGTGIKLFGPNHLVILQKVWSLNEQKQAVARIYRIGQKRKPRAFILHTKGGIEDQITKLRMVNGGCEVKFIHRLMDADLTYQQLMIM